MTTVIQIVFGVLATLIIGSAVMVVAVRNIIHSALWLIACFFGVGALYLLLEAEFIAVAQILIYVGSVAVLILFAIMLTRDISGEGERQLNRRWWLALIIAGVLFSAVMTPILITTAWNVPPPPTPGAPPEVIAGVADLGRGFVKEFLIQFQVAGVLLTVALIGAIVIAFEERARRRRVLTLAEEHELRRIAAERRVAQQGGEPTPPQPAAERE
jgi:NADH-quinone oxidoreductase subunit J